MDVSCSIYVYAVDVHWIFHFYTFPISIFSARAFVRRMRFDYNEIKSYRHVCDVCVLRAESKNNLYCSLVFLLLIFVCFQGETDTCVCGVLCGAAGAVWIRFTQETVNRYYE